MSAQPGGAYSLARIGKMLGLARGAILRFVEAGYVTPTRGARNAYVFSFQDVVLLRTAARLQAADIPPQRLLRALRHLRAQWPSQEPLSQLRIEAVGDRVAVQAGGARWEPESGQWLMDLEGTAPARVEATPGTGPPAEAEGRDEGAEAGFRQGEALEPVDPRAAALAYRRAIARTPEDPRAWVNLGALLCDAGRCGEALALYERAVLLAPEEPAIHFNGAIALEDLGMEREAIRCYERCLDLAPWMADAHYNAARLYEKLGEAQGMLRHFNAFRRLQAS